MDNKKIKMNIHKQFKILSLKEKKQIENKLKESFGIKSIYGTLLQKSEEKIFLFQGSLTIPELQRLERLIPIERAGVYFAKLQKGEIRLSIEGTQILKDQITKNIFELDEKQTETWMMGEELDIQTGMKGFIIIKYKEHFLGCGKASFEKISNLKFYS